jgi:hypothetical protein
MRKTTRGMYAVLAGAISLSAAACGSGGSSAAADPLAGMSATKIASKVLTDFKAASSVHVSGTIDESGQNISLDLSIASGGKCQGTLALGGSGSMLLISNGTQGWAKPSTQFWKSEANATPAVLSIVSGKYVTIPSGSSVSSIESLCSLSSLAGSAQGIGADVAKGSTSTLDGQTVIALKDTASKSVAYVTDAAKPELVRLSGGDSSGSGDLTFTAYDVPVTITPPPSSQVLDGSKYGF